MGIEVAEVRTGQPGVQIIQFQPGSRAEQAGLRKGDVIISVNGKTVASIADVASQLSPLKPGQSVDVLVVPAGTPTVARGNTARLLTRSFSVPLVSRSGAAASAPSSNFSNGDRPLTELGLVVRNSSSRDGVLVTSVVANSAAEKARLVAGDRIVSVNGARVTDIETLNRVIAARDASSDALRLQWVRGSQLREAPVKLTSSDNGSTDQDPSANDGVTATSGKSILNQLGAALGAAVRNKIQPEPTPQESESLPAPLSALEPTESTVQPIESPVDRPLEPIKTDPLELGDDEPVEKALFQDEKPTDKTK
jgi:predicted metalloprotease with PDZ domain